MQHLDRSAKIGVLLRKRRYRPIRPTKEKLIMNIFIDSADLGEMIPQLFKHPLTDQGLEKFLADAKKAGASAK